MLVRRNLIYFRRTNLAVIAGVATAVAVLTGALLVGDSVRGSLRDLALARLGKTEAVVSSANFFREQLAAEIPGSAPLIALQGIVTHEKDRRRAANVSVYGVDDRFWKFHGVPTVSGAALSEALARELNVAAGDTILIRVEKPSAIPTESLVGRKEDSGRTIRFDAGSILDRAHLGEFSLRPTQGDVYAVFVPLRRLQRDLAEPARANTLLLASNNFPKDKVTLDDLGIKVRALPNALSIETSSAVLSDALVDAVKKVDANAQPVFSYLANAIRIGAREVPYSLVTAMGGRPGLYLDDWAARDLAAKIGDAVTLEYYYWEPSGSLITRTATFPLAGIVPMTGLAIDRDLVPEYPGITGADTIGSWDPPFPVDLKRVRPRDEEYWKLYRTAPKAFLSLKAGQDLWGSRFGKVTSMRIDGITDAGAFSTKVRAAIDPSQLGMAVFDPRAQSLASAEGSTDFGQYFTYFSFFLVVSALLLAGLFFQLGIEQRLREIGTLRAVGFSPARIRRIFVAEGFVLAIAGSIVGTVGALAYGWFLLYGLKTWWRGAVGTSLLTLHVSVESLAGGAIGGVLIAWLCILLTLRSLRHASPRDLLGGTRGAPKIVHASRWLRIVALISAVGGIAMVAMSFAKAIDNSAGFFGAGTLLLIAAIFWQWSRLRDQKGLVETIRALGFRNASFKPGRSVLSIALIASAVFLVVALDAFRRPPVVASDPKSGAGGFPFTAESQLPIFWDPNTPTGRDNLNIANITNAKFYEFRLRPGDDSSCLNLYEPRTPRVLGARQDFIDLDRFSFSESVGDKKNPWLLLNQTQPDGAIPAIADANSITYVLHKKLGDTIDVNGVKFRLVAALDDSIFQSEVIIAEKNFTQAFPEVQGFRYFLIDGPPAIQSKLADGLADYGFDVQSTVDRLAAFHRVENTYLSTFQALGGLGLILGTLGLGAVLLRNVMERRKELALLRAVGYRTAHLQRMVIAENAFLLLSGILIGTVCAVIAIAPAFFERGGHPPDPSLALLLLAVPLAGMLASIAAVRAVARAPVLDTLRAE